MIYSGLIINKLSVYGCLYLIKWVWVVYIFNMRTEINKGQRLIEFKIFNIV